MDNKTASSFMDKIIDYENGELDHDEVIELFQGLVDNGMAWKLQGSYGRTAMELIHAGLVHSPERSKSLPAAGISDFYDGGVE